MIQTGSWNDAETSREIQAILIDPAYVPHPKMGIVSDTAFPCGEELQGRIVSPLKENELELYPEEEQFAAQAVSNAITSIRQAAEWGMGAVEKPFRRLTMPLPYDPHKRGLRISNIFHLYNLRVRKSGISQIRSVFYA